MFYSSSRRDLLKAGLAAAALTPAMLLPGIGRAQGNLKPFTFVTPFGYSLSFSPVLYAKSAGFFEREGLDVTVHGGKGAAQAAQLVVAGQSNVARTGGGNFITAVVKNNAPLVAIATIAQISPFSVITPANKPIAKAGDFKNKTIGMASLGGSMENTLDLMLLRDGVDKASVKREKVADNPGSFGLVEAGRIDGFMGNVSTAVRVKNSGAKVNVVSIDDGIPGQPYVASREAVEKDGDLLARFLRAVHKSASAILDAKDLDPILDSVGKSFEIRALADRAVANEDLLANAELWVAKGRENLLRNVPEVWASAVEVMGKAGLIETGVDAKTLYTNALWDKAVKG